MMKTEQPQSKEKICSRCHCSKSLQSFDKLKSGALYGMCRRCVIEFQKEIAKHPAEKYTVCGPAMLQDLSDLEQVQLSGVRAVLKHHLGEGDTIEMAFAAAILLTSDDATKLVDNKLVQKYLGLYGKQSKDNSDD